ncbi:MAG: VWA domain-containing protein, partial [Myxococcales bacterium]|nr:VWA domain-containing protein [Myxococcales bacterium]
PPPAMAPSPPQRAAKGAAREEGSLGDLAAASGGASASADAGPPPPMASAPAMEPAARSVSERKREMAPRDEEAPMADPTPLGRRAAEKSDAKDKDASGEWAKPYRQQPPAQPVLDWGATVYLSNDDSMSLASAQRLLWAVDRGAGFSSGEVRPHELLNYFSFDTAPVAPGETFSVLGGAEQDGDTLSVALAVQGAMPPRQPLDLTLVIDRSGSMRAEGRMEYVRKGLVQMTDQLVPGDRVDLVLFDSAVCSPLQNFVVGRDDPSILTNEILRMQPRGSTDLDGGLREGYRIQTARDKGDRHNRNQRVLLLTDAMLNSGNVNEALVSEIGKRFDEDGIRVTGVGVGREFNDKMLNKITEKGKGAYVYLGSEAVVDRVFGAGFDSLVQTIAHDVQFSIDLPDSLAMEKFYGEESSTNAEDVQPINYYAGTSQLFLQDLKVKGGRVDPKAEIVFRAKFREATTGEPKESTFRTSVGALLEGDTHNLKKAQALMKWTDLLSERAMGDRSCGGLGDYRRAAAQVQGDAEIAYVSGLTGKLCGVDMSQTIAATGVKFKVKVDADMPIPEVQLACSGESWSNRLSGSDTVARFDNVYPGECRLTLQGNVPMVAAVTVPETGGDVRCMVRGGRMSCD